tara:strand:+ start:65593 stop:65997 length:405 start_codon:yes stop_codon:yes gene_type:complete
MSIKAQLSPVVTKVDVQHVTLSLIQVGGLVITLFSTFITFTVFVNWLDTRLDDQDYIAHVNSDAIKRNEKAVIVLEKNWREGLLELGQSLRVNINEVDQKSIERHAIAIDALNTRIKDLTTAMNKKNSISGGGS